MLGAPLLAEEHVLAGGEKTKDTLQVRGDVRAATGANFATGRVMCKTGACGVQLHPGNSPKKLFCSPGYQDNCGPKWVENPMPNPQEPPCVPMVLPTVGSLDSPISGYSRNPFLVSCGDGAAVERIQLKQESQDKKIWPLLVSFSVQTFSKPFFEVFPLRPAAVEGSYLRLIDFGISQR